MTPRIEADTVPAILTIEDLQLKRLLFVCSGNTCRSPLAEGIAKASFKQDPSIEVSSAGSAAVEGYPASEFATEVARNHGMDISGHRSRSLDRARIREADLIVTMESRHREAVGAIEPAALEYTYVITDFCAGLDDGIPDPIGGYLTDYQRTFDILKGCLEEMKGRLVNFDGWKKT